MYLNSSNCRQLNCISCAQRCKYCGD